MGKSYLIGNIVPRITAIVSNANPTVNTDLTDGVNITALAVNITSMTTNLSGTPDNFQSLVYRILDNGTARTISWGASFVAMGASLPTTTVISTILTVVFSYDSVAAKWGCVYVTTVVVGSSDWSLSGNTLTGTEHSPNEFLGSVNNFDVILKENNTEVLRLSDGLVGINQPAPSAKLEVKSDGVTSASFAVKITDSSSVGLFSVRDDGAVGINSTPQSGIRLKIVAGGTFPYAIFVTSDDEAIRAEGSGGQATIRGLSSNAFGTGVFGSNTVGGIGVKGNSITGRGIYGFCTSGVGGYFESSSGYSLVVPVGGGFVGIGTVTPSAMLNVVGDVAIDSVQLVVSGSTSGNATFSQPQSGVATKEIIIYCNALLGTASYTFPTAFTNTPGIVATSVVGAGVITSLSNTAVTVTGAATTGFIKLIGF